MIFAIINRQLGHQRQIRSARTSHQWHWIGSSASCSDHLPAEGDEPGNGAQSIDRMLVDEDIWIELSRSRRMLRSIQVGRVALENRNFRQWQ